MDKATPEGLAAEAEALWPRWVAHLAALAAGAQPSDYAGSGTGARLAQVLEALWLDRGEAAGVAAGGLWARALGREDGGVQASVASVSALLTAFRTRPDPCLELAVATHLAILCCATLLPGSGTKAQMDSPTPMRGALEQLCFKICPEALLGALGPTAAQRCGQSTPIILRADPSLPHRALLLGNVLSSWRRQQRDLTGPASLLEELEWVRSWMRALDALADAGTLTGPTAEMQDALLFICSRVLNAAANKEPTLRQVLNSLLEDPRLLRWYAEELVRTVRDECLGRMQGTGSTIRGHLFSLYIQGVNWPELRVAIAGAVAAQARLQDWWLKALAALSAETEAACRAGAWSVTWPPLSTLHCGCVFHSTDKIEQQPAPAFMASALVEFSRLHRDLHSQLLASDAAAAQRTEAAAVEAAYSCLRAAHAIDGWQGELADSRQRLARMHTINAHVYFLDALSMSPAFSCEAALSPGAPRVPGKRAVAAVIEVVELVAEALRVIVGMPSLHAVHLPDYGEEGAAAPLALCSSVADIGHRFLSQRLPGRQVPLISCVDFEQVRPLVRAMLRLLCAQRGAMAWLQGPGRSCVVPPAEAAQDLGLFMESNVEVVVFTCLELLERMRASPGSHAECGGQLADRWQVGMAHLALPAALAAHTLPGNTSHSAPTGQLYVLTGFNLAQKLEQTLNAGGEWSSVHAWAAQLMRANVQTAVTEYTPGEAAQLLLSLLDCIDVEKHPIATALAMLAGGVFTVLARWSIRVTWRPTNLLEPNVAQALQLLEEILHMASRAADSLLLLPGEEGRFAAANECHSAQVKGALETVTRKQLQSRKQLEAHGIGAAVRGAWEQRRDQLLPPMERGARCGSAFVVTWQPMGRLASGGGTEAAAAAPRRTCPLPAVQQALALAGVACANPLCTRQGSSNGGGCEAALERLQRCRGCRVAGYCCAACGREDWERHRPACNTLRRLRRGAASVQPAVGLRRA